MLSMPVMIAPMSYGALSASTKRAVGLASTLSGIAENIEAIDALEEIGRRQDIELVVMGGIRDGVDAVKALCLGADAVAFGTSAIVAGGCIACMQCHIPSAPSAGGSATPPASPPAGVSTATARCRSGT